jgi:hypothetical protein
MFLTARVRVGVRVRVRVRFRQLYKLYSNPNPKQNPNPNPKQNPTPTLTLTLNRSLTLILNRTLILTLILTLTYSFVRNGEQRVNQFLSLLVLSFLPLELGLGVRVRNRDRVRVRVRGKVRGFAFSTYLLRTFPHCLPPCPCPNLTPALTLNSNHNPNLFDLSSSDIPALSSPLPTIKPSFARYMLRLSLAI